MAHQHHHHHGHPADDEQPLSFVEAYHVCRYDLERESTPLLIAQQLAALENRQEGVPPTPKMEKGRERALAKLAEQEDASWSQSSPRTRTRARQENGRVWSTNADDGPMSLVSARGSKASQGMAESSNWLATSPDTFMVRSDLDLDHEGEPDVTRCLPPLPGSMKGLRELRMEAEAPLGNAWLEDDVPTGPMWWVESSAFQALSGLVILLNAIIIGLETDIHLDGWWYAEQIILIFFVFELSAKMGRAGVAKFFKSEDDAMWNFFDFLIVAAGVADQWAMPVIEALEILRGKQKNKKVTVLFTLMRIGRLLRIVRLFRLVRIVRPLYELAQGVLEALGGMFWVLVFMVMTLYAVAIVCTNVLGHGTFIDVHEVHDQQLLEIRKMFSSVPNSMFTLFGTISSWSLLKFVPLFEDMPLLKPLFVLFYVYSAWAMLAIMTGVVSENMIAIREQMMREDEERESMRRTLITNTLHELFRAADTDNSGTVSREEFDAMMRNPHLMKKLMRNTNMRVQDLHDLFDWLDHDGGGTITIDEFMQGFKWVNEPLRAKSLVKFQERLVSDVKSMENKVCGRVRKRLDELQKMISVPMKLVYQITEQMQNLDSHFGEMRQGLSDHAADLPTPEEVKETEYRLIQKANRIFQRLEEIEAAARDGA